MDGKLLSNEGSAWVGNQRDDDDDDDSLPRCNLFLPNGKRNAYNNKL